MLSFPDLCAGVTVDGIGEDGERPYVKFLGIGYPEVLEGDNPTVYVKASIYDRKEWAEDDAIRLSEVGLTQMGQIDGKPILARHDGDKVGDIVHHWVGKDKRIRVFGRLFVDSPRGIQAVNDMKSGKLGFMSIGYSNIMNPAKTKVLKKNFDHWALVPAPLLDGCKVIVCASKDPDYKSAAQNPIQTYRGEHQSGANNMSELTQQKMDTTSSSNKGTPQQQQQQQQPAVPTTTTTSGNNVAQQLDPENANELLTETRRLKQELEKQMARNKSLEENNHKFQSELKERREKEAQRVKAKQEAYRKANEKKLNEMLELQKQMLGVEKLPENWTTEMQGLMYQENFAPQANIMNGMAQSFKKQKTENEKLLEQIEMLKKKNEQFTKEKEHTLKHLKSVKTQQFHSQDPRVASLATGGPTHATPPSQTMVPVNASKDPPSMQQLPKPTKEDLMMFKEWGTPQVQAAVLSMENPDVKAGANLNGAAYTFPTEVQRSQDHQYKHQVQHSWANTNPAFWWAMHNVKQAPTGTYEIIPQVHGRKVTGFMERDTIINGNMVKPQ